ncbi:unnamed protein product [Penicillium egyptiacum]|uniref:NB-ARC domain-containing protein n=1 Tax=Penicillium egyptiacum TaxID=1303716 RepID=A0A9W4P384_9EURO|nr:unnamed protein product [Penicillium egyptiacum]
MLNNKVLSICGKTGTNLPKNRHGLMKLLRIRYHQKLFQILQHRLSDQESSMKDSIDKRHLYNQYNTRQDHLGSLGLPNEVGSRQVDIPLSLANKKTSFVIPGLISDLYHGGNDYFGDLLRKLNPSWTKGSVHQREVIWIYGTKGLGKTHLCSEFADKHKTCYSGVFWFSFSKEQTRFESLDPSSKIRTLHQLSDVQEPWLLIIDNAPSLTEAEELFPCGDKGHILVTTKSSPARTTDSIHVLDMDHEDKKGFLLWDAGFVKPWSDSDIAWNEDVGEWNSRAIPHRNWTDTPISKDALKLLNISSFFTTRYITLVTLAKSLIIYEAVVKEQRRKQSNIWAGTCRIIKFSPTKLARQNGEVHNMPQASPCRQIPGSLDRSRATCARTEFVDMSSLQHHPSNDTYSMDAAVRSWKTYVNLTTNFSRTLPTG